MNNSTHFYGNSVFGQLISLVPFQIVDKVARQMQSDYYTKRFTTWEHFVSMLFASASNTTSLRDVTNGMLGLEGKLKHLNLKRPPKRSTLSDANKRRNHEVFEKIYYALLEKYKPILSDSRFRNDFGKELSIIDSTSIFLFKDLLKCVGRKPASGKHKGGIKVHMQIRADYNNPVLVKFTDAATHDSTFMNDVDFSTDHIYVFDKGYNDYDGHYDYDDDRYYDDNGYHSNSHHNDGYDTTGLDKFVEELETDLQLLWDTFLSLSTKHTFVGHQRDQVSRTTTSPQPFKLVGSTSPGGVHSTSTGRVNSGRHHLYDVFGLTPPTPSVS
jgi:hypothetical protein